MCTFTVGVISELSLDDLPGYINEICEKLGMGEESRRELKIVVAAALGRLSALVDGTSTWGGRCTKPDILFERYSTVVTRIQQLEVKLTLNGQEPAEGYVGGSRWYMDVVRRTGPNDDVSENILYVILNTPSEYRDSATTKIVETIAKILRGCYTDPG